MRSDRVAQLAEALATDGIGTALDRLLRTATSMLGVTGASLALVEEGQHLGAMAVSDPGLSPLDELQFTLGEGPCIDATRTAGPILEPDLERTSAMWPAFASAATALGCRAVFTFPLRVGAARVGVLSLYRDAPGELDPEDLRDATAIAQVATHLVLAMADGVTPDHLPERLDEVLDHRRHVHQATGMIAAQLDVDVGTALASLRALAWSRDRSIDAVAEDVVNRRLRFDLL